MDSPRLDVNTVDVIQLDPSMNSVTLHQENAGQNFVSLEYSLQTRVIEIIFIKWEDNC